MLGASVRAFSTYQHVVNRRRQRMLIRTEVFKYKSDDGNVIAVKHNDDGIKHNETIAQPSSA